MNSNNDNTRVGRSFQDSVQQWLEEHLCQKFEQEKKIAIGNPAKLHKFDIVSLDNQIVVECKCYSWTESGNVPSAKMGFTNEAALYLSFLSNDIEKNIIMLYATHERRHETLAEYYFRTNRHLLGNIKVFEFDIDTQQMNLVGGNK